ncbi:hypothetical protein [Kineococcus radiotolerans]|uniref:Uncharacterized protein n=1 Tax=Kineococcus radiotolerans (strain ATCC BAA-149 / DSM 14245 / SRS30216) TaxID=266940 RepID=A6WH73_KINRD|nr:hypothetical protein [Kineococcus radiotolerans]ABS06162.1 hypothetical protein Krad_4704 [Kineococcus radiotolerans SRS30216 = ATCC BAA-149]
MSRRRRPVPTTASANATSTAPASTASVSTLAPPARFALLVTTWFPEGHRRQRLLLSLAAAQRARDRALAKRHPVSITLVELAPVAAQDCEAALAEVTAAGAVA